MTAAESVLGPSSERGARFSSARCPALLRKAERRAFRAAGREIDALADAARVEPGAVTGIADDGVGGVALVTDELSLRGQCDEPEPGTLEAALADIYGEGPALSDFDSKPRAEVKTQLVVTRAVAE